MRAMAQVWCGHEYTVKNLEFAAYVGAACSICLHWDVMQPSLPACNASEGHMHACMWATCMQYLWQLMQGCE